MLSLNGRWILKDIGDNMEYAADVPSCNYLDLMANGVIEDPFKGTNEKDLLWVAERDWSWFRHFDVAEEDLKADRAVLVCKQLDTLATVLVNREAVAYADNCHVVHEFDIKKFLRPGRNQIEIIISSPVKYITEQRKLYRTPANPNGIDGIDRIRKPQCHFGWDWGPVLPPSGITGDIYIDFRRDAEIAELSVQQTHDGGRVSLRADVTAVKLDDRAHLACGAPRSRRHGVDAGARLCRQRHILLHRGAPGTLVALRHDGKEGTASLHLGGLRHLGRARRRKHRKEDAGAEDAGARPHPRQIRQQLRLCRQREEGVRKGRQPHPIRRRRATST